MTLENFLNYLRSPPSWTRTIVFTAIVVTAAWAVFNWNNKGVIDSLREQVSLSKAQAEAASETVASKSMPAQSSKHELQNVMLSRMELGIAEFEQAESDSAANPEKQKKIREAKKIYSKLMQEAKEALESDQLNVFHEKTNQLNQILYSGNFFKLMPKTKPSLITHMPRSTQFDGHV